MMSIVKTPPDIEVIVLDRLARGPASADRLVGCVRARRADVLRVVRRLADEGRIEREQGRRGEWHLSGVLGAGASVPGNAPGRAGTPGAASPDASLLLAGFAAGAAVAA